MDKYKDCGICEACYILLKYITRMEGDNDGRKRIGII